MTNNRAFFWIAGGTQFIGEAIVSAREARDCMPNVMRVLFTPDPVDSKQFTEVIQLPARNDDWWYVDFVKYLYMAAGQLAESGVDYAVFLDADVHLLAPVPELFELAARFDVLGAHAPGRKTTTWLVEESNHAFPEINTGVLGLNLRNVTTYTFLQRWRDRFLDHREHYQDNDQGPFRDALLLSPALRFGVLPPEYHVRTICGGFAGDEVKILHGRLPDVNRAKDHVNQSGGMRTFGSFNF